MPTTTTSSIITTEDNNNATPGELGALGVHDCHRHSYSAFSPPPSARRHDSRDSDSDGHDPHSHYQHHHHHRDHDDHFGFFTKLGAIELENKGSVARDHLALERTFLAWLRTSLAFASIGIAITQLFRLNSTSATTSQDAHEVLKQVGKPLGATFLAIAVLVLMIGTNRYYESQAWLLQGKFPASRGSVFLLTIVSVMLIVASLVVVMAIGAGVHET